MTVTPGDHARVCELLGREPRGRYEIVVRDEVGDPVVLKNAPFLDDGTPMPTRYWLVGPDEIRRIGQLESDGGVDRAEAEADPDELAAAHDRYATERDDDIPADHTGPRPSGGVGGTRIGVKCLHAHWGWHLAGGDDPIGRWIETELARREQLHLSVGTSAVTVRWRGAEWVLPVGNEPLCRRWLTDGDPPRPAALTNALGEVTDHLDDVVRERPEILDLDAAHLDGPTIWSIARLEAGSDDPPSPFALDRATAEEVFRLAATESRADRADNPGLPSSDVETVLGDLCVVIATIRRLGLQRVVLTGPVSNG